MYTVVAPARSRMNLAVGVGLALVVLAGAIFGSMLHLRGHMRAQIASRDGESLEAVAAAIYHDDQTNQETIATLDDPGEQLELALKVARMRKVLGVRLFSPAGEFVNAFPGYITESQLSAADQAMLRALNPVSHFLPGARLEEQVLFAEPTNAPTPLLEVDLPLHEEGSGRLAGIAQFLLNGTSIAAEYATLDRHLAWQALLVFAISGGLLGVGLTWSFSRLQRANQLLSERTSNLLKANRELALAARTSAVGALASHLIHGLKNPLSGLQSFVRDQATNPGNAEDTDWRLAVTSTQRMQDLINRIVRVLQEQQTVVEYEMSFTELADLTKTRLGTLAESASVRLETTVAGSGVFSNREADLVLLILENLGQNAIEATPSGKRVRVTIGAAEGQTVCEVQDEGPGVAAEIAPRLFAACTSTKSGGSGIGLAISRQIARHLGGELALEQSSDRGCTFRLTLPRRPLQHEPELETTAAL